MRNFISPIIAERKPIFIKQDYKKLGLFIDHFYQFLEEQGNPLEVLENFVDNSEPNNAVDIYIDKILTDLGFNIQKNLTISKKELIHHLKEFYLSRGSEASFKFLFKLLYGSDLEIGYPRTRMLVPSQATYSGRLFIFTTTHNIGTELFDTLVRSSSDHDVRVRGVSSKEDASVESISLVYTSNQIYLKIQVGSPYHLFQKGEGIEIISQETGETIIENFVDTGGLEIVSPGKGYSIGDRIQITNHRVTGEAFVKTLVEGSVSDLEIQNGGQGYAVGDSIRTAPRERGHSFSAAVTRVDDSSNYLTVPHDASLNISSGDFTIEMWVYPIRRLGDRVICSNKTPGVNNGWTLKLDAQSRLHFQLMGSTTTTTFSTRPIQYGRWSHIAVVRDGTKIRLFINGIRVSENTVVNGTASSNELRLGISTDSKNAFVGYMTDFRITQGAARYTGSFSVSNQPFSNTDALFSQVSLWIPFNGVLGTSNFIDSSNYNHTITTSGSVFISNNVVLFNLRCGYFSGLGPISQISIFNHGYDYDSLPRMIIQSSLGSGANLVPLSDSIGQIESIEVIEPFIDSYGPPVATVVSTQGTGASLEILSSSIFKESPSWKSFEGVLGINSTLLDSYYYQQFSYYTRSTVPRKEYDEIVDEWCHPAGFVRFAILDISFVGMIGINYDESGSHFYLVTRKIITGRNDVYMVNPIYNLHYFKELSQSNYMNWVGGFDWIQEEWTHDATHYLSQGLGVNPIVKYYMIRDPRWLVNPQSGLNGFKESQDNYAYDVSHWDDMTVGDPPIGTTDPALLSRKRVNDDTSPMSEALDSEITITSL
jgi:hypothetical protein